MSKLKELTDQSMDTWGESRKKYEDDVLTYAYALTTLANDLLDRHYDANVYSGYLAILFRRLGVDTITFFEGEILSAYKDLDDKLIKFLQTDNYEEGTRTITMAVEDKEQE